MFILFNSSKNNTLFLIIIINSSVFLELRSQTDCASVRSRHSAAAVSDSQ